MFSLNLTHARKDHIMPRSICRIAITGALAALVMALSMTPFGCGGSGGAQGFTRNVKLTANQETAANSSTATGTAEITLSKDKGRIVVVLQTTGLTNVTAAHIHAGLSGTTGLVGQTAPIVFPLFDSSQGAFSGSLVTVLTSANFTPQPAAGINTFEDAINAIEQGRAYVNVHTQANPSGEIRGQILPNSFTAQLSGTNETPSNNSVARGAVSVTIDPAACKLTVNGSTALLSPSTVTAANIQVGAAGAVGPAIFQLFNSSQGPYSGFINKDLTATDLIVQSGPGINTCNDAINAIILGRAYINVLTTTNPTGEIRGQLTPTPDQ